MPVTYSFGVIGVCLLGIMIGSFRDYEISAALAHVTGIGDVFATVSPMAAYALLPVGWGCFYTGLKKKASSGRIPGCMFRNAGCFFDHDADLHRMFADSRHPSEGRIVRERETEWNRITEQLRCNTGKKHTEHRAMPETGSVSMTGWIALRM